MDSSSPMTRVSRRLGIILLIVGSANMVALGQTVVQGRILEQEYRYEEARSLYRSGLETSPRLADAHYRLGLLELRQFRNIKSATEHVETAVELEEENTEYHFIMSEVYAADIAEASIFRKLSLMKRAKRHMERAVELDPNSILYLYGLVQFYTYIPGLFGGSKKKAHAHADRIESIDPYSGLLSHAWIFDYKGKDSQALASYRRALELEPDKGEGYNQFGYYYLNREEFDKALVQFNRYVEVAPDSAESHYSLGEAFYQMERYPDAIDAFVESIERDSRHTGSIYRLAQCYDRREAYEQALAYYEKYIELVPAGGRVDAARDKIVELSSRAQ